MAKKHTLQFLLLLLILLLPGCTKNTTDYTTPVYPADKSVLRMHLDDEPVSLDPAKAAVPGDFFILPAVYRGLFRYDAELEKPVEDLLSSWEVTADGLQYTFYLDEDAKFSNGKEITADDVKFSFERLINPVTSSPWSYFLNEVSGADSFRRGRKEEVEGIEVITPTSLVIKLEQPLPDFVLRLTHPAMAIVSRENVEAEGAEFGRAGKYLDSEPGVVVSGALIPVEWVAGSLMSFAKNKYYPAAAAERLEIDFLGKPGTIITEWRQKKWDIIQGRKDEYLESGEKFAASGDIWQLTYLQFQEIDEAWNDFRLRLALGSALERNVLASSTPGLSRATRKLLPDQNEGEVARSWNTALDLVKLAGFETVDAVPVLSLGYAENADARLAEQIVEQLADFGFEIELLEPEQLEQAQIVLKTAILGHMDQRGWLTSFYREETAPEDIEELTVEELHNRLLGTAEVLPLFFAHQVWLTKEEVDNFSINQLGLLDLTALKK